MDNSDAQYRSFRNNLLLLSLFCAAFVACSRIVDVLCKNSVEAKRRFYFVAALTCQFILHGFNIISIGFLAFLNYKIGKMRFHAIFSWSFIVLAIVLIESLKDVDFSFTRSLVCYLVILRGSFRDSIPAGTSCST